MTAPLTYTVHTAAEATGLSVRTIDRAIKAGDLRANRPKVDGQEIAKVVIAAKELERWATGSQS